jgi:hypothetical protein
MPTASMPNLSETSGPARQAHETQARELEILLKLLLKHAEQHRLSNITLSVARVRTILAGLRTAYPKSTRPKLPSYYRKLDRAFGF